MKLLLLALALVSGAPRLEAAAISITGTAAWKMKLQDCIFSVDGTIQNNSPGGSISGTIMLVLWAAPAPFPAQGYRIADHTLGQLNGGYQFNSFTAKVPANVPNVSGDFYFTISVLEYTTTSGWMTRDYVDTGIHHLENGVFITGEKWRIPKKPVTAPPATVHKGDQFVLTLKATDELNLIVEDSQVKWKVALGRNDKATVTIAGDTSPTHYTYDVTTGTLRGNNVPVGRLILDDGSSDSTITLYFQGPDSGIYKNVVAGSTAWGVFTYK